VRALALLALAACGGHSPETRFYALSHAAAESAAHGDRVIAVEALTADGAYDDDRMIYRASPYRLDYYQYHHWSATPGVMVGGFLEQALARTGSFRSVVREPTADAALVVGGRVVAIEEVDRSATQWLGRIAIELAATDPHTGEVVWTRTFDESEPMPAQSPEGLARALSIALDRIASRAAPELAELAGRHQARR
jgi:ABC-type uncharacterized transport system auxiliary subunit